LLLALDEFCRMDSIAMTNDSLPPKRRGGRPSKNNSPTSPRAIEIAEDVARAWELRKAGRSYREIASALNVSHQTAYDYIKRNLDTTKTLTQAYRDEYRAMQLDELDRAIRLAWQQMQALPAIMPNDPKHTVSEKVATARARGDLLRTLIHMLDRQAKLLGLDAPTQVEDVTPRDVPYIVFEFDPADPADE
jgi:transposase